MKRFLHWLAMVRRKVKDPYTEKSYTWFSVMVPSPSAEAPLPCILVSLSNGHSKILIRFRDLTAYHAAFDLGLDDVQALKTGLERAEAAGNKIEEDIKFLLRKRQLKPGEQLINTGTGEIVAEAEQIIKDANDRGQTG